MTVEPAIPALTNSERATFNRCEGVIHRGIKTFWEVGEALLTIRNGRLYREQYSTWKLYCSERWNMDDSHANRLIQSHDILKDLGMQKSELPVDHMQVAADLPEDPVAAIDVTAESPENRITPDGVIVGSSPVLPIRETQARPLAPLAPDERRQAWHEAVETAGGQPTERQVRAVVQRRTERTERTPTPEPAPLPTSGIAPIPVPHKGPGRPSRKPLPDQMLSTMHEAIKLSEKIDRLIADDRFPKYQDSLRTRYLSDIKRIMETLTRFIDKLN